MRKKKSGSTPENSINPVDFKIREGKLKLVLNHSFPLILGNDRAGTVVKSGKDVKRFAP